MEIEIGIKETVIAVIVAAVLIFCIGSTVSVDPVTLPAVSELKPVSKPVEMEQKVVDISGLVDIHSDSIFSALVENERQASKADDKIADALRSSFNEKFDEAESQAGLQAGEQLEEAFKSPSVKPVPVIKAKQPSRRFVLVIKSKPKPKPKRVLLKPKMRPPSEIPIEHYDDYASTASSFDWPDRAAIWVAKYKIIDKAMRAIDNYGHIIGEMSVRYNLPIPVVASIIAIESGGDPTISSYTNDHGLMQLNWKTLLTYGMDKNDAYDPYKNIRGGCQVLRDNLNHFNGNYSFAITAYNRGPGTVDKVLRSGGNPVTDYAERVLCAAGQLEKKINLLSCL